MPSKSPEFKFDWSTPSRALGSRELPIVSNEIYLTIFDYFEPSFDLTLPECKSIWANLAHVCRFFCAHFMGKIYEEFVFEVGTNGAGAVIDKTRKQLTRICRGISHGAGMPSLIGSRVQRCIIRNWPGEGDSAHEDVILQAFLEFYRTAMPGMANLRTLRFEKTAIDDELLSVLLKCKHLTRLEIVNSRFDPSEDVVYLAKWAQTASTLARLPVEEIRVISTTAPAEIAALFRKVSCQWKQLAHFRATGDFLDASYLFSLRHPDKLRTVALSHVDDPQRFAEFLQSCKHLERLEVESHSQDFKSNFAVAPSAVPQLSHLHSTNVIAQVLVKGRRISHLRLCRTIGSSSITGKFLEGVKSLRRLCVPYSVYVGDGVKDMSFPLLTELRIGDLEVHYPILHSGIFHTFIRDTLPSFAKQLHTLEFSLDASLATVLPTSMLDLEEQYPLIPRFKEDSCFPNLTRVSFDDAIMWNYTPESNLVWIPTAMSSKDDDPRDETRVYPQVLRAFIDSNTNASNVPGAVAGASSE